MPTPRPALPRTPPPSPRSRVRQVLGCLGCAGLLAISAVCAGGAGVVFGIPGAFRALAAIREQADPHEVAPSAGTFVRVEDVEMYVVDRGRGQTTVVLISGSLAWSGTWRDTIEALVAAGFRVVAIDLPPFGYSTRPAADRYSRGQQAERILGVLDHLRLDRVALVAHSFGAGPASEAAMLAPERIESLTLVDGAVGLEAPDPGWAADVANNRLLAEVGVSMTFTNPTFTPIGLRSLVADPAVASPDRLSLYQRPLDVRGTTSAITDWLPELVQPTPGQASLDPEAWKRLHVPVLLLWGDQDTVTPVSQAQRLDELLPEARVELLPGLGHIPQIEDPSAFHGKLIPFLRECSGIR